MPKYLDFVTAGFVAVLLVSNVSSAKIVQLGPFTFDGGTVLFPLAYILGDILTESSFEESDVQLLKFHPISDKISRSVGRPITREDDRLLGRRRTRGRRSIA